MFRLHRPWACVFSGAGFAICVVFFWVLASFAGQRTETSAAPVAERPADEWPQLKGSSGFTGTSANTTLKPPLKLLWTYRTDGDATGEEGTGLIVAAGKVFVSQAMSGSILALDAKSGEFLWEAGRGVTGTMAPAYSDGRLFVWATRHRGAKSEVLALDAATGKTLWQHTLAGLGHLRWGVPVYGGKVLCSEGGDKPAVIALDEKTGKEIWRTLLGSEDGKVVIPPSAANGRVFVGIRSASSVKNPEGATLALDASDGKVLWRRKNIFPGLPLVSDGQVVACPMDGRDQCCHLLDATSGKTIWSSPPGISRYQVTLTEKLVLLKLYGPNFTALDRQTGKVVWKFDGGGASGCCTPSVAGNFAYFGTGAPSVGGLGWTAWSFGPYREKGIGYNLYAVDLTTAKAVWKFVMGMNVCADPAIAYGRLYASGMDGRIYCFGPAKEGEPTVPEAKDTAPAVPVDRVQALLKPERIEQLRPGNEWPMLGGTPQRAGLEGVALKPPLELAWKLNTGGRVQTSPAIAGGKVYVGSDAGTILAIDAATGKPAWKFQTGGKVRCSPALAGTLVYCGSDDGKFHALDAASGQAKWSFAAGGPVRASPAVVGGVVLFGADDHNVYALDRHTGRKLWNFRSDYYSVQAPPVVHEGQVFVAQWVNWVYALDITTGKPQWRSYVPRSVESLAFYQDKLWVRAAHTMMELEPQTGKRLRAIEALPYGSNGVGFLKNTMFVAGLPGAASGDLEDIGRDPVKERPWKTSAGFPCGA